MLKLKILIVENEPADAKMISDLLENDKEHIVESFTFAKSYDEACDVLATGINFDLSILDIKLDGHKSYDLFEHFAKHRFGLIAFMTGEDIPTRINRIAQPVLQIEKPFDKAQISNFISEVKKLKKTPLEKFGIYNVQGENILVYVDHICSIEADKKHCTFYCCDEEKKHYFTIDSVESFGKAFERVQEQGLFIQCFRSWIVNPDFIIKFKPDKDKGGTIYMDHPKCGEIPYSDNFKSGLYKLFNLPKHKE